MINELQYKNRKKLKSWLLGTAVPVRGGAGDWSLWAKNTQQGTSWQYSKQPDCTIYNHLTIHCENDGGSVNWNIETQKYTLLVPDCMLAALLTHHSHHRFCFARHVDRLAIKCQKQAKKPSFWAFYTHFSWNIKSFFSSGLLCYLKNNLIKGPNNSCRASLLFWRRIAPAHCKCSGLLGSSSRRWRHNKNGKCVETTLTKICNQANSFAKLGWNNLQEFLI